MFKKHFSMNTTVADVPLTVSKDVVFVCNLTLEIVHLPVNVAVWLPTSVTAGLSPAAPNPTIVTPATSVRFSVYVPGLTKIVSPLEAAERALAMVVCVPCVASAETTKSETPNVFVVIC